MWLLKWLLGRLKDEDLRALVWWFIAMKYTGLTPDQIARILHAFQEAIDKELIPEDTKGYLDPD